MTDTTVVAVENKAARNIFLAILLVLLVLAVAVTVWTGKLGPATPAPDNDNVAEAGNDNANGGEVAGDEIDNVDGEVRPERVRCEAPSGNTTPVGEWLADASGNKHYCLADGTFDPTFDTVVAPASDEQVQNDDGDRPRIARPESSGTVVYNPPVSAMQLVTDEGVTVGVSYVLTDGEATQIFTPAYSTTIVVGGNFTADGITFTSDGTIGNIYMFLCRQNGECAFDVEDYTAGHLSVTTVFSGMENPNATAFGALTTLFQAPNCGDPGCLIATLTTSDDKQMQEFDSPPNNDALGIDGFSNTVTVSVLGVPNARVIEIGGDIVGRTWTMSGDNQHVSVPEGDETGTIIVCQTGCTVNGQTIEAGGIVVLTGFMTDDTTPDDLNMTAEVSGDNVTVYLIYGHNVIELLEDLIGGRGEVTLIEPDGTITTVDVGVIN